MKHPSPMLNNKLISALRRLDSSESERFGRFVNSPFFNRRESLCRLSASVLQYAPAYVHQDLRPESLYREACPEKHIFDEADFNNLCSDLLELLSDFLAFQLWEQKSLDRQLLRAEAMLRRDLDKHAAHALQKARKMLDGAAARGTEFFLAEHRWWELDETLYNRGARRSVGEHLSQRAAAADRALILEQLRLACAMLAHNRLAVVQAHFNPHRLATLRRWCLEEKALSEEASIRVYLAALNLLEEPSDKGYTNYLQLLEEHAAIFPVEERRALYQYALNYGIKCVNDGRDGSYPQVLTLYRIMMDRGLLLQNGALSQWTFKNIVTAGLRSGEFRWTEQFIRRYENNLPPVDRSNAFTYSLGALQFEQKRYGEALQTLQSVEFTDFSYHLGAKILQLKTWYILGETEALHSLLAGTEKLLRRNKSLSEYGKNANLNFLRAFRLLLKCDEKARTRTKTAATALYNEFRHSLENINPLANKEWLRTWTGKPGLP